MKTTFLLAALALTQSALARDNYIEDLGLIDLRAPATTLQRTYPYPGLHGRGHGDSPDCLIFVEQSYFTRDRQAILDLLSHIEVRDGTAMRDEGNVLPIQERAGRFVIYLQDLGKYLTGITVSAKNGRPLGELAQRFLPDNRPAMLLLSRNCSALNDFTQSE